MKHSPADTLAALVDLLLVRTRLYDDKLRSTLGVSHNAMREWVKRGVLGVVPVSLNGANSLLRVRHHEEFRAELARHRSDKPTMKGWRDLEQIDNALAVLDEARVVASARLLD